MPIDDSQHPSGALEETGLAPNRPTIEAGKSGLHRFDRSRAFAYLVVPEIVVPDQLKGAVVVAYRYEPGIRRTCAELARRYGT